MIRRGFASHSRRLIGSAFVLAMAGASGTASAQLRDDPETVIVPPPPPITDARSMFTRDREIPVAQRMLPAFSAQGVKVGNFRLYPGLPIAGQFTSNIFADNQRRRSDLGLILRPQATLRTSAGPYNLDIYGASEIRRFTKYTTEDTEEVMGGVRGSVMTGALSSLAFDTSYGTYVEPRSAQDSPINAAKPLEYDGLDANVTGTFEGSATRIVVRGDLQRLRFHDTPSLDGGTLFTRDRDRSRYQGLARVERAISPATSVYVAGSVNRIDYRLTPVSSNRDSSGYGLYLGSSFELTDLMRGDVRVGYIRQSFDLSRFAPISGLGLVGNLLYFPTRLLTVTIHGESSIQDSGVPGTAGYLHRGGSARADLELRRYIIASLEGGYFRDAYRGIPRRDDLPFGQLSATYLSKGHWNARVGYRFTARRCTCTTDVRDFDEHRLTATLTFQY